MNKFIIFHPLFNEKELYKIMYAYYEKIIILLYEIEEDNTIIELPINYNFTKIIFENDIEETTKIHKYKKKGDYIIKIYGDVKSLNYMNYTYGIAKMGFFLKEVIDYGYLEDFNFAYNRKLIKVPNYLPDNVYCLKNMFFCCKNFNCDISNWDVSRVTNMKGLFFNAQSFNQDISNWNVSNVTNMNSLFLNTNEFNQDISKWDVSQVTDMTDMFFFAKNFNKDISSWNVSNVEKMNQMFYYAKKFNQNISNWKCDKVINSKFMFNYALDMEEENKPYL
jgi:surface protein